MPYKQENKYKSGLWVRLVILRCWCSQVSSYRIIFPPVALRYNTYASHMFYLFQLDGRHRLGRRQRLQLNLTTGYGRDARRRLWCYSQNHKIIHIGHGYKWRRETKNTEENIRKHSEKSKTHPRREHKQLDAFRHS